MAADCALQHLRRREREWSTHPIGGELGEQIYGGAISPTCGLINASFSRNEPPTALTKPRGQVATQEFLCGAGRVLQRAYNCNPRALGVIFAS